MDHGVDDEDDDDHLNLNIPEGQHQILSMSFFGDGTLHTDRHCYVSIGLLGRGGFSDVRTLSCNYCHTARGCALLIRRPKETLSTAATDSILTLL